jgi:hypothetical protein
MEQHVSSDFATSAIGHLDGQLQRLRSVSFDVFDAKRMESGLHSAGKSSPNAERPASIDMIAIVNANSAVVRWSDMVQLAGVEGEINSLGRDATLRL